MQRGSTVQKNWVILNHLFENVPNDGILLFYQLLGLLNSCAMASLLQPVIDEWLKQFKRHLLRQTALVQLQLRTDHNDGAARVIDTLTEQVLTEPTLLALECIGERLERSIVRAAQHASTAAVIEQRVDCFLQHPLFIANDHVGSM